jgi:serine/threonine protein phosphatase PrpC
MSSEKFNIESGFTSGLEWCTAKLPKKGEKKCGDAHLIEKYRDKALLAVVDGLGHGKSAARASTRAKYLMKESNNESLINIVNYCHQKLRSTRGVVMSLALVDSWERTLTWLGVGNVQGILLPGINANGTKTESIILRHGIVGYKLPVLQATMLPIAVGDMLIFATDGVRDGYLSEIDSNNSTLNEIVEFIASDYFKSSDDALILVARFVGEKNDAQTE